MTRSRVMRIAGWTLAAVILPLAVFAAVSMGLRLGQHGLSPARLWGFVAIVVAVVCGAIYWLALVRGRKAGWAAYLRKSTFQFGLFVCGLALLLALPIVNFSAISTSNQVARLQSGAVPVDEFDFAALRWDFGEPGRRALARLARSNNPTIAELATAAQKQTQPVYGFDRTNSARAKFNVRVQPDDPELRELVLDYLVASPYECARGCIAVELYDWGSRKQVALIEDDDGTFEVIDVPNLEPGTGVRLGEDPGPPSQAVKARLNSQVEIRPFEGRRLYVDGTPFGPPFE